MMKLIVAFMNFAKVPNKRQDTKTRPFALVLYLHLTCNSSAVFPLKKQNML